MHIQDDRFLSAVATASSLFNSGGRIIWGAICDKFSFKVCPLHPCIIQNSYSVNCLLTCTNAIAYAKLNPGSLK